MLSLNRHTLAGVFFGVGADKTSDFIANGILIIFPVRAVESIDTMILEDHHLVVECQFCPVGNFRIEAGSEHHCFVYVGGVES